MTTMYATTHIKWVGEEREEKTYVHASLASAMRKWVSIAQDAMMDAASSPRTLSMYSSSGPFSTRERLANVDLLWSKFEVGREYVIDTYDHSECHEVVVRET